MAALLPLLPDSDSVETTQPTAPSNLFWSTRGRAVMCVRCGDIFRPRSGRPRREGPVCAPCLDSPAPRRVEPPTETPLTLAALPELLRAVREARGLTQEQLARALGVTCRQLQRIEQGKRRSIAGDLVESWLLKCGLRARIVLDDA